MANLVITSTTNSVKVDFGVYGVGNIPLKGTWRKDKIINFSLQLSNAFVIASTIGEPEWQLSYDGTNGMQVDSVDGVAPTSNSDLYDKLIVLIA